MKSMGLSSCVCSSCCTRKMEDTIAVCLGATAAALLDARCMVHVWMLIISFKNRPEFTHRYAR